MKKMNKKMQLDIFNNENFDYISNLIESKIELLHTCENYNIKFKLLTSTIDALSNNLLPDDKELFDEVLHLFYSIEDYYSVFAYSLGTKYGLELKKL